jgi:hypothetical protein
MGDTCAGSKHEVSQPVVAELLLPTVESHECAAELEAPERPVQAKTE